MNKNKFYEDLKNISGEWNLYRFLAEKYLNDVNKAIFNKINYEMDLLINGISKEGEKENGN